jgi:hypothetical protein
MPFARATLKLLLAVWALLLVAALGGCGGNGEDPDAKPVAPTLVITSEVAGLAAGPFTLVFSFSAAVSDFATNRILIGGGYLDGAALVRASDTVYTLQVTPTPGKVGLTEVTVPAGAFKDSSGKTASTRAYNLSQPYDTVLVANEPVLTITDNASSGVAAGAITFALSFSLDVGSSFSVDKLLVTGGTITSFVKGSATQYTVVVTPPAATNGTVVLLLPVGAVSAAGTGVVNSRETGVAVLYSTP